VELRRKGASYAIIAEILRSINVVVSHDTVARFCHEVLELTPRTRRPRKASVKALQHDSTGNPKAARTRKADSLCAIKPAVQSEKGGMPDLHIFRPQGVGGPRIADPKTI
jgi:transposase-like protein